MRTDLAEAVAEVRAFNRFYTSRIGLLQEHHMESPFTLTEARVLYELAHREALTASDLCRDLGLDAGYVSRLLRRFASAGLVERRAKEGDGRSSVLALTAAGRRAFAPLDAVTREHLGRILAALPPADRQRAVAAMRALREVLGPTAPERDVPALRPLRAGDLGWIVHRHGVLYAEEYGLDPTFEALVAEIGAAFVRDHDPAREAAWVAEASGAITGSIFVVAGDAGEEAKLRLLYVEPSARGQGTGGRLVAEAVAFARAAGYRRMTLWTTNLLLAARRLYEREGFRLAAREARPMFGREDVVGETWTLDLAPGNLTP